MTSSVTGNRKRRYGKWNDRDDEAEDVSDEATRRDEEAVFGPDRRRRVWAAVLWVIVGSLWVQWLGPGAWAEFRSEDGSAAVLMLQGLPFVAAAVATTRDHRAWRMALVPLSFLPGLAMLPEAEWEALATPVSVGLSLATFALYLVVAARGPAASPPTQAKRQRAQGGLPDRYAASFHQFVVLRFAVMAVLFAVITYGLFFAPSTQEALSMARDSSARTLQHVFAVVLMYFAWLVAVYVGAVLPALSWEHDRRRTGVPPRQLQLLGRPGRLRRRVVGWVIGLSVVIVGSVWVL